MKTLFTIGHSNHTLEEFISLLKTYNINVLVDIRTIPKSRHVPWFNKEALSKSLNKAHIKYLHNAKLGGLRHTSKTSVNTGWRNASFRGFADYMQTPDFFAGLNELNALLTKQNSVAIMCAEAVPWRCHRSLIADAELVRHIKVIDILSKTNSHNHELTTFAVVDHSRRPIRIYYPEDKQLSLEL